MIHRDIKPSNLLLDAQGNVWVTDFGLAKLVEGDDLSQSHDLVGTLRFMAPERFRGVTDPLGDVYSLGATLYELLTLKPAFAERDQARLIDQITHEPPAPLRQHDRRIPRDLETIVLKALAKDPKDRFAIGGRAGGRAAAVPGEPADPVAAGRARRAALAVVQAQPRPGRPERPGREPDNPHRSFDLACLDQLWQRGSIPASRRGERSSSPSTRPGWRWASRWSPRGRHSSARVDRPAVRQPGPARQGREGPGRRPRGPETIARDPQPCHCRPGSDRPPRAPSSTTAATSSDQRRCRPGAIRRCRESGEVVVRRLDDDRELVRLPGPDRQRFLVRLSPFSPDGELLVALRPDGGRRRPGASLAPGTPGS